MDKGSKDILIDTTIMKIGENSGIDTAGFLSRWLLQNKPAIKDSYK
jgi:hypothetical protein